jgi:hypothetical protein
MDSISKDRSRYLEYMDAFSSNYSVPSPVCLTSTPSFNFGTQGLKKLKSLTSLVYCRKEGAQGTNIRAIGKRRKFF